MKRIEVKLSLPVVVPLIEVIKGQVDGLLTSLAAPVVMSEIAVEFGESWNDELLAGQAGDVSVLLALFDEQFYAEGVIALDASNAEPVLRACAAVRLRLRERHLKTLGDDTLETSDVDPEKLDEPVRQAFLCYLFLATLQELIIQHLDPTTLES